MKSAAGRRKPLSRDRVVAAALEIVDREGLEGLTMRTLGRELGVDPMAVYHHLPNKAAVLDGVAEAVMAEVPMDVPPEDPWPEQMARFARGYRDTLRAHPNALPVVATRPDTSPAALRAIDTALGILLRAGFAPADAVTAMHATSCFVIGHAMDEFGIPLGTSEGLSLEEVAAAQREVVERGEYPNLVAVAAAARVEGDDTFEAGVAALTAGFNAHLFPTAPKNR